MTRREMMIESMMFERLLESGEGACPLSEKLRMLESFRSESPEASARLDRFLLESLERYRSGLRDARAHQQTLRKLLDEAIEPPWHPATWVRQVETAMGQRGIVWYGGRPRLVVPAENLSPDELQTGDAVFLNHGLNLVLAKSPGMPAVGETVFFERWTGDGRLVARRRDKELVIDAAAPLQEVGLRPGDQLRWDRDAWMAFEKIDRPADDRYLLDDVPDAGLHLIGGQRENLRTVLATLTATLIDPDKARRYGIDGRRTVLLIGPPGCGKTLMARVAAAEISRTSGRRCRFAVVKPAEWESPWVGETQANIRRCFESLRQQADDGCAILFLDEIEAVGRIRGSAVGFHSDKFLAALLAEIDGFRDRSNVAIVAATNRKDLIDPALLSRISAVEVFVARPDLKAAREILGIHLPETLPFSPNGKAAAMTRDHLIERAVSRLYSPNGGNEVCTIRFRNGNHRTVAARELASGRLLEQICQSARLSAWQRDMEGGEPGLTCDDIDEAVSAAIARLSTTLTRMNAHAYLADLPQDMDVVSVEPVERRVRRPHRYVNVN